MSYKYAVEIPQGNQHDALCDLIPKECQRGPGPDKSMLFFFNTEEQAKAFVNLLGYYIPIKEVSMMNMFLKYDGLLPGRYYDDNE